MAACAVVDRVIIRQAAGKDRRPVDGRAVEAEMREQMQQNGCRSGVNEVALRRIAEQELPIRRTMHDLAGEVAPPRTDEVMQFYRNIETHLPNSVMAEASHILVHVTKTRSEEQARELIQAAAAELDRGTPFAQVAEQFSDCKGDGGYLPAFERGTMVHEFDEALFAMKPGERTAIFRSPFGFHIAQLHMLSNGKPHDPGTAQRQIEAYLTAKRRHEALQRGLESLRDEAVIERVAERAGGH